MTLQKQQIILLKKQNESNKQREERKKDGEFFLKLRKVMFSNNSGNEIKVSYGNVFCSESATEICSGSGLFCVLQLNNIKSNYGDIYFK